MTWVPSAIAAALAIIVGVQYFRPAQSTQPPAFQVLHGYSLEPSRGAAVQDVHAGEAAVLYINVVDPSTHAKYVCDVRDAQGHVHASLPITAEQTKETVPIALLRPLPAGSYELVVYGIRADGNRDAETGRYPFDVGP